MGECVWGMCIHMFVCVCVLLKEVCTLVPDFLFVFLYGGNIPQNCYKYMIFFFFLLSSACIYIFFALLQQDCDSQYLDTDPSDPWTIENIHLLSQYLHCIQVLR